jgi:hypothetical protein
MLVFFHKDISDDLTSNARAPHGTQNGNANNMWCSFPRTNRILALLVAPTEPRQRQPFRLGIKISTRLGSNFLVNIMHPKRRVDTLACRDAELTLKACVPRSHHPERASCRS